MVVAGSFWSHIRPGAPKISIDEPRFRWMREHGTLHIPDLRDRTISTIRDCSELAHFFVRSPSSAKENLLEH